MCARPLALLGRAAARADDRPLAAGVWDLSICTRRAGQLAVLL